MKKAAVDIGRASAVDLDNIPPLGRKCSWIVRVLDFRTIPSFLRSRRRCGITECLGWLWPNCLNVLGCCLISEAEQDQDWLTFGWEIESLRYANKPARVWMFNVPLESWQNWCWARQMPLWASFSSQQMWTIIPPCFIEYKIGWCIQNPNPALSTL